jgi:hypothetical protein
MTPPTYPNVFVGQWSYRSWLNDTDLETPPAELLFGKGTIEIVDAPSEILRGTIGGPNWKLDLFGSRSYGDPGTIRFRGKGIVSGAEWIYDYVGYLVPEWPNGVDQKTTMVGSIVRAISHPSGGGIGAAGLTASWYAVKR